jgi:hypothetical protein
MEDQQMVSMDRLLFVYPNDEKIRWNIQQVNKALSKQLHHTPNNLN